MNGGVHAYFLTNTRGHDSRGCTNCQDVRGLLISQAIQSHRDGHREDGVRELEVVNHFEGDWVHNLHGTIQRRSNHTLLVRCV